MLLQDSCLLYAVVKCHKGIKNRYALLVSAESEAKIIKAG